MNALAAYGLLAHALIFGACAVLLPWGLLRHRVALAATTLALAVGIAPLLHGAFGVPSLTLLQLAILQLAGKPAPLTAHPALFVLLFALLFYPLALGWGAFDPYAAGYQPTILLGALALLGAWLCWQRQNAWLIILAVDLAGYAGGLFPNLWDALIDPLLVLLAAVVVGRKGVIGYLSRRKTG